jgi:hypothetical protein
MEPEVLDRLFDGLAKAVHGLSDAELVDRYLASLRKEGWDGES